MLSRTVLLIALVGFSSAALRFKRDFSSQRVVRQTQVSSNGNAEGTGEDVIADAMAHHYKNADGTIGMNVTSTGNATSNASGAEISNLGKGQVGDKFVDATGDISASGDNAKSEVFSDIFAEIYGDMMSITNYQEGRADGTGDTQVEASGHASMEKGGVPSPANSDKTVGTAGATGSDKSLSEVSSNQVLTWDQLIAQLFGHAKGEGKTNAQANVDLGAGNANTGIEVNGLVSGVNNNGGDVKAEVTGNGAMMGNTHELSGSMSGSVEGTGPSQLVGASNLQSNMTGANPNITIAAFGDAKADTDGDSKLTLDSETNASRESGVAGQISMGNEVNGATKNMTVQNGLQVQDTNGGTLAIGYGETKGNGTENSAASITVDSKYNENGQAEVVAKGDGTAVSNDRNSSLSMEANALISNADGQKNGVAILNGNVMGAQNNLTGRNEVKVNNGVANGEAYMEANGGGVGNSAADTSADLTLKDGDVERTSSVQGNVVAKGDQTKVKSISQVSDKDGIQTLSNMQHATSQSKGSSSASASNSGWLKRRKRASLGGLYDKLF